MKYTYFTFQHRRSHESPWLKEKPIKKIKPKNNWDFGWFGQYLDKLNKNGNKYVFPGGKQVYEVWSHTGSHGYRDLKYAKQALNRLQKASESGELNIKSSYNQFCQSARYEFRIVKVKFTPDEIKIIE